MTRFASSVAIAAVIAGSATLVAAQPAGQPAAELKLPTVGEAVPPNGTPAWPTKLMWLYDVPSFTDSGGKVVIHWFCAPKIAACTDDLARVITLKENNPRVYIVAYINGSKNDAKKLDPIRESEGVGRGTVAFGNDVATMFKKMSITGPASIVVDVDGKAALVTTGSSAPELDARDAKVAALSAAIKEYSASSDGPKQIKPNEKFTLTMKIQLASWLRYSKKPGTALDFTLLTVPKDIKCDNTKLKGDQLKIEVQSLTAQVSCSGPAGSYEMRGQIDFGYDTPSGATGMGTDGATWKFTIK
jgi:hypothetical protein